MQKNTSTLSRRKVTAGIAWSVPAVAAVAAAPAFAASPKCISATTGDVVKFPGGSTGIKQGYGFPITLTNPTSSRLRISARSVLVVFDKKGESAGGTLTIYTADPCAGGVPVPAGSDELVIEPGEPLTLYLVISDTGSSANDSGCINARLGVQLVTGEPVVPELCDEYEVPENCFSDAPPTATC